MLLIVPFNISKPFLDLSHIGAVDEPETNNLTKFIHESVQSLKSSFPLDKDNLGNLVRVVARQSLSRHHFKLAFIIWNMPQRG